LTLNSHLTILYKHILRIFPNNIILAPLLGYYSDNRMGKKLLNRKVYFKKLLSRILTYLSINLKIRHLMPNFNPVQATILL
ncbi:hypothetical protein COY20_00800, partial [Candidatus Shapirobacteria bacterium CG_4_10_14_0_2_um_filter_40_12]